MEEFFAYLKKSNIDQNKVIALEMQWVRLNTPKRLGALRQLSEQYPEDVRIRDEVSRWIDMWDKEQQAIADNHIHIYERDGEIVGYTFKGIKRTTQKWILCGSTTFVEAFKRVVDEDTAKVFQEEYKIKEGSVDRNIIRSLDEDPSNIKLERILRLRHMKDADDSGWYTYNKDNETSDV